MTRSKRHWDYPAPGKAGAVSHEPIAVYQVEEVPHRKKRSEFHAHALTEAGPVVFQRQFRTMQAAQRFCEADVDKWRRQIAELAESALEQPT
jgi:hypothetical protein